MKKKMFEKKIEKKENGQNQQNRNFPKNGFGSTYTP